MPAKHPIKILPTREYLLACFIYDLLTGALTWKRRPRNHFIDEHAWAVWNTRFAGKPAGFFHDRYYEVWIDDVRYKTHRIIFKWMTGEEPPETLDHINGDTRDNRWANLRPATQTQQNWNARLRKDNTIGFRGVSRRPNDKYQANTRNNNVRRCLGTFPTAEEASAAFENFARRQRGEFFKADDV